MLIVRFLPMRVLAFQVSLAAQRRWLASEAAAVAARSEGSDSLSKLDEEMEEERLYRQVRPEGEIRKVGKINDNLRNKEVGIEALSLGATGGEELE